MLKKLIKPPCKHGSERGDGRGMFALPELQTMEAVVNLDIHDIRQFGRDIRILAKCAVSQRDDS